MKRLTFKFILENSNPQIYLPLTTSRNSNEKRTYLSSPSSPVSIYNTWLHHVLNFTIDL